MKLRTFISFFIFLILAVPAFADWSPGVTEEMISSGSPDLVGDIGSNTATIYARFKIAAQVSFRVTGPDVWAVYDVALGEDIVQEEPLVILNDGGAMIDIAFHIGAEDIVSAPDAEPWVSRDTWAPTTTPSEYTLGIIVCDDDVLTGPVTSEFEDDDIILTGSPAWYLAAGQFRPFTSTLVYSHEGDISLALLSSPDMNTVHTFFRLLVSNGGSLDDYPHAARIVITCRLSSG